MWPSLAGKWISVVRSPASSRSKPNGRSKPKTPQRFDGKRPIFGASVAVRGGCLPPASKFCVAQSCVAWQTRAVGGPLQRTCRGVPAQRHTRAEAYLRQHLERRRGAPVKQKAFRSAPFRASIYSLSRHRGGRSRAGQNRPPSCRVRRVQSECEKTRRMQTGVAGAGCTDGPAAGAARRGNDRHARRAMP